MNIAARSSLAILILTLLTPAAFGQDDMSRFVTRSGDTLMEGDKEYRFVSFNIPNLHLVEDNMAFEATNEWRFPDEYEITDALTSVRQMGGRVVRIYVMSICRPEGPNPIPCHVRKPGEFDEEAFRALDRVLQVANRVGVRVIIPFVDNWKWWGGVGEYAAHRGKPPEAFWTDPEVIGDFKKTIDFVVTRRNTYTGTLYKDDKAILAWETGNELSSPYSWTKQIAAHIKSLDRNHLVCDGFYIGANEIIPEALDDPNIDIVSSHHYPGPQKGPDEISADIVRFHRQIAGKKAYVVGEFGFIPLSGIEKVLDTTIAAGPSGAMIWSLRFRNRDGGFYWHSEGATEGSVKAYHDPGFASGDSYLETDVMRLMRAKAYEIRRSPVPALEAPAPPVLLPIASAAEISWRGSVGASGYDVERATKPSGPWSVVGLNVDDASVQYRPLFADTYVRPGDSYYYRVKARNATGVSAPSNVVGPVRVDVTTVVDELRDLSQTFARGGDVALRSAGARPYKEDAHRLAGKTGGWVMYRTLEPLRSAEIWTFMEGEERGFEFYVSGDGTSFTKIAPKASRFPTLANPYGYKLPVRYELSGLPPESRVLKIVFATDAQIGRVVLRHGGRARR